MRRNKERYLEQVKLSQEQQFLENKERDEEANGDDDEEDDYDDDQQQQPHQNKEEIHKIEDENKNLNLNNQIQEEVRNPEKPAIHS